MAIAFPHGCEFEELLEQSPVAIEATVRCTTNDDRFLHVTVDRCVKGNLAEGDEIEIRPAMHAFEAQAAQAAAQGLPVPSFSVPRVKRRAPDILAGRSYEFLLTPQEGDIYELAGVNAWRVPLD